MRTDDHEFCVIPLSRDVLSNPFRCHLKSNGQPQSLLHAIITVSVYHADKHRNQAINLPSNIIDHRNIATKLYRDELDTYSESRRIKLLDTTMIIFLFHVSD